MRATPPEKLRKPPVVKKAQNLPANLPRLVPLQVWADLLMGEHAPHKNTLRNWVNSGRIHPRPVKIGKRWFVQPDAEYISD
ncbi:excisionase [Noviherbaspirillum aridicola]|nr:excisionase [Noviherbaspirillum aridicola]